MYSLLHSDKVSIINRVCQSLYTSLYPTEPTCGKLLTLVVGRAWLCHPYPCGTALNIKYQTLQIAIHPETAHLHVNSNNDSNSE